jgi:hypothetical protein
MNIYKLLRKYTKNGVAGFLVSLRSYCKYHFKEKWKFTYFKICLEQVSSKLPNLAEEFIIRIALPNDIFKIKNSIYPHLTDKQENDKRDLERIGENDFECVIVEFNGEIVHYFIFYYNAIKSPLSKTPFKKEFIESHDSYLGSAFTTPVARGLWIVPHVLLFIFSFLKNNNSSKRGLLLVHEDTPGAIGFFLRMGFIKIENPITRSFINKLIGKFFG